MFVAVCQDAAGAHSQRQLDHLRQGHASQGAGWLRAELSKLSVPQLRQLTGAVGLQQTQSGRSLPKVELLEALARHISEQQAKCNAFCFLEFRKFCFVIVSGYSSVAGFPRSQPQHRLQLQLQSRDFLSGDLLGRCLAKEHLLGRAF